MILDEEMRDVAARIRAYADLLDGALSYAKKAAAEYADSDDAYRVAHARAFVEAKDDGSTDALAKAKADLLTEGIRKRARLAEAMNKMAQEAIRSRRTQISAEQSLLNVHKSEADYGRTGPREVA
jgi:hypothetical protein